MDCKLLLGPRYAILDERYSLNRNKMELRSKINSVLVSFGGTDEINLTGRLLDFICSDSELNKISFNIIITESFKYKEEIKSNYNSKNINIFESLDCLSDIMLKSDISIGAGGTTTWERFAMGLPSVVVSIAENQEESSQYLNDLGLIYYLGPANTLANDWPISIKKAFLFDEFTLYDNSLKISKYVDTLGCQRIVTEILKL